MHRAIRTVNITSRVLISPEDTVNLRSLRLTGDFNLIENRKQGLTPTSPRELKLLPDLIRSVRQDGRTEDDIILFGNFGCSDSEMSSLQSIGMLFGFEGIPTTVTGEAMLDNIVS